MSFAKLISIGLAAAALAVSATGAFAGAAVATAATSLLDGPIAGAAVVATVAPGAKLGVLWCGMQGQWCLVSYHAKQGFVGEASLHHIAGQLAVGSEDVAGGDGNDSTTPGGPHLVLHPAGGSLTSLGGNGGGGSSGGKILATSIRPR